jgi:pimeloyl-ACP methyl ester carboxylesterase
MSHYAEWVRGWLWAQGIKKDLVLCGFTSGAAISLEYGLTHPDEVLGLVLSTASMRRGQMGPDRLELRLKAAAGDEAAYKNWYDFNERAMEWVEPGLRAKLMKAHVAVGPMGQYKYLTTPGNDQTDRIASLKPKLLLIRGKSDIVQPEDHMQEVHEAVPGSRLVRMDNAGHFPPVERPDEYNRLVEEFVASL